MSTGFVLEVSPGGKNSLTFDASALERSDVSYAEKADSFALVLGCPYRDGPGWVQAQDVLALNKADRLALPRFIHGFFAVVAGSKETGEFMVATDRFGGVDLFISSQDNRLIVSDSVEQIARRLPSLHLDATGMLQYLEIGCMLGETTQFEELRRIGTSRVLEIKEGRVTRSRHYWDYGSLAPDTLPPGLIEDIFSSHVRDAFQLCDRAAMPLTGGIDSRAILSACPLEEERLQCYTFGNAWNIDSRIAARICLTLDLPHSLLPVDKDAHERYMDDLTRLAGDCNGLINFYLFAPMLEGFDVSADKSDLVLTGIGGEFLRGCLLFSDGAIPETAEELVARMMSRYVMNPSEQLLKSPDGTSGREEVRRSLERLLGSKGISDLSLATECFYLENRVANFTARATRPAGKRMKIWDPWLNTNVLEAARQVPMANKADYLVHREIITRNNNALAGLLLSKGGVVPYKSKPPGLVARSLGLRAGRFSLKAVNKATRATLRREVYRPHYARDLAYYFSRNDGDLLRRRLQPGEMRLATLISPDALQSAIESFINNDSRLCYVLTNLLCAESWLERLSGLTSIVVD